MQVISMDADREFVLEKSSPGGEERGLTVIFLALVTHTSH